MKLLFLLSLLLIISATSHSQDKPAQPEAIGFTISLPWVNQYSFYNYHQGRTSSKAGFVGVGASAFYTKGNNKFSCNYGFTGDLPVPIGAFDYAKEGTRTNILSNFLEGLYHRSMSDRINFITGLNLTRYHFRFTSYVDTLPSYSIIDKTIGLTLGAEYCLKKNTSLAIFYRPAIIFLDKRTYRHVISIDARFDIRFWKRG